MERRVHQLVAGAEIGDAITEYSLDLNRTFLSWGINSFIYSFSNNINNVLKNKILPSSKFLMNAHIDDYIIYHHSINNPVKNIYFKKGFNKILCYHNITPYKYFLPYNDGLATLLRQGLEDLYDLKDETSKAVAVSNFNANDLCKIGFSNVKVIPLNIPLDYLEILPDNKILKKYNDGFQNILSVGRLVPNKKIEDIILTFAYYKKYLVKNSRLILVGDSNCLPSYVRYIKDLIKKLNLEEYIIMTGKISKNELIGFYNIASLYLCLSEHEGFCLPLIESMFFKKIVFALDKGAISETLGESGVLIKECNHKMIAELIFFILNDNKLKQKIIENQNRRVKNFIKNNDSNNTINLWKKILETF